MRYVLLLVFVCCVFAGAALLREHVFEPAARKRAAEAAGVSIGEGEAELTVRWQKLKGYQDGEVTMRLPQQYKPGFSRVSNLVALEMRFAHIERWKTPPPFPPDMVAEIAQGFTTADERNAFREGQRLRKRIELTPATWLLEWRRRFIDEAPALLAGAYTDKDVRRRRPMWPGANPYSGKPDGVRAGLHRFSRLYCFAPNQLEGRQDLVERLKILEARGELLPGNCYLDRLNTVYVSPADTPAERWTTVECNPYSRSCEVRFIAAGLAAQTSIWEADVDILERYTEPVRAALAQWVTAKPLP